MPDQQGVVGPEMMHGWKGLQAPVQIAGGTVYLIGVGPGALDLLTLRAVRILQELDVAIVDHLISPDIRSFLKETVTLIEGGKMSGDDPSYDFEGVCQEMIEHARMGRVVGRLKGGDPMVFARVGEEMDALTAAGVPFEIVPGVSAGMAASAAVQIPLNHRDFSHSVSLVTGHNVQDRAVDWAAMATTGGTLVIYMGVARAARVARALIAAGVSKDMPVALVQDATLPSQSWFVTSLDGLEDAMSARMVRNPAIIIVGPVVNHAHGRRPSDTARVL